MKRSYTFIIIEDVKLQRENLEELLSTRLELRLAGAFENAHTAYEFLGGAGQPAPDLIFLDIEMPEASGFNFLDAIKNLNSRSRVIITSAFAEYAIKGYEYNNLSGYLLKPIEPVKLNQAVDKAIREIQASTAAALESELHKGHLLIKEKGKWVKIYYEEILYCEAANVEVRIVTAGESYHTRDRLKNMEKVLPTESFLRTHDSFIINLAYVKSYASNFTFVELCYQAGDDCFEVRIGPKYRDIFRERMKALEP